MPDKTPFTKRHAPFFALNTVVALALLEPTVARLEKLGDTLTAKQYLFIMPTGEVSYFFPSVRDISIPALGIAGIFMLFIGLIPAVARLRRKGLDGWSALGWALLATGVVMLSAEYRSKGEWVLFDRIGARYLAFTFISLGAILGSRDKRYYATCGLGGFSWDLSSAIFWAWLQKDPRATVPVPWHHHFDQGEGAGAPCWLVALADSSMLGYFNWMRKHDLDPLRVFDVE
jgi:hypothetical protein